MKKGLTIFLVFLTDLCLSQSTNISGIINSYAQVTAISSTPCIDSLTVLSTTGLAIGDSVLIIQMKGAGIDSTNTSSFGTINSYGNCGNYEVLKIASIIGNNIRFTTPLKRNYTVSGKVQLVTIPYYINVIVTGTLTSQAWNGYVGGILAFNTTGSITLNADINLNGLGFRGGIAPNGNFNCGQMAYYFPTSSLNGGYKGEGIANFIISRETGRGAQANGGGGGNNNNAGGAGGGNFSFGGRGGNQVLYGSCSALPIGGEPGKSLSYSLANNKIFLGGGGGSGHQNDNNNVGINGTNGGGIIFIKCNTLIGNNQTISCNGLDNTQFVTTDGAGGGGAGGTILLDVQNFSSNLNLELIGGKGGGSSSSIYCLGTGGGGAGGTTLFSGSSLPANVITNFQGGNPGLNSASNSGCSNSNWGASNGNVGSIIFNWVTPQPSIVADAGPDSVLCQGQSVQIGTPSLPGLSYQWSNGITTATQLVTPSATTTYTLTVNDGACFFAYDSVVVNIAITPTAAFSFNQNCNTITFNNNSLSGNSYFWYFGDGDSSLIQSPIHTYASIGNYTVTLIVSNANGCFDSIPQLINVSQQSVQASFNYLIDTCAQSIQFNTTSLNGTNYNWIFQDSLNSYSVNDSISTLSYTSGGVLNVIHIVTNACDTDSVSTSIILPLVHQPLAQYSFTNNYCTKTITFNNQSVNATYYQWGFGDGLFSTLLNPTHTYNLSGSYTVVLIVSNSCYEDTVWQTVNIQTIQSAIASFTPTVTLCSNTVSFVNNSINAINYVWLFGDSTTSNLNNPTHTYTVAQSYTVILIAYDSCTADTMQIIVNLIGNAIAQAAFNVNFQPCDLSVSFGNQSQYADSVLWSFGDGTSSTLLNLIHEYQNQGIYPVTLIAFNNCGNDTLVQNVIDTFSVAQALFTYEKQSCTGEVKFLNQSLNADFFYWDFGDGTTDTSRNPVHEYMIVGDYTVVLIVNPGTQCADTVAQLISITETDTAALFIPNAFTPNGDGSNEFFEIKGVTSCLTFHLEIYNRWGNLIYQTDDIKNFWNGKYKGKAVSPGVYYYLLEGNNLTKHGSVTVLR